MNQREINALDRHISGNFGEDQFKGKSDTLMTDADWSAVQKARMVEIGNAPLGAISEVICRLPDYVPWQLANDADTYGDQAGWWIVVSPDFEDELSPPFATLEECQREIERLNTAKAEAHADPYPDRQFPEDPMN